MKKHPRFYIAIALCLGLVLAGCGLNSSAAPGAGTPTEATGLEKPGSTGTTGQQTPGSNLVPSGTETPGAAALTSPTAEATTTSATPSAEATTAASPTTAAAETPPATPTTAAAETPLATPTTGAAETPLATETPLAGATPGALGTPSATAGGAQAVSNAFAALAQVSSFRMTTMVTTTTGQGATTTLEFAPPGSFHLTTADNEIIAIKDKGAWQRSSGGQWQALASGSSDAVDALLNSIDPSKLAGADQSIDTSSVQGLGTDTLNGKTMNVYQYTANSSAVYPFVGGTTKLWVGADDGLPYQSETNAEASAMLLGQTFSSAAKITSVYEYNTNVTIQPPM